MKPDASRAPFSGRPVQRKVFDVMRPGRAPANSTSKPVIVSHKPMIQDPSVTMNGVGEPRSLLSSRQKITITPVDGNTAPQPVAPPAVAPAQPAPSAPVAAPVPASPVAPDLASTPVNVPSHPAEAPLPPAPQAAIQPAVIHPTPPEDVMLDDMPAPIVDDHVESIAPRSVGPKTFPWKTVILVAAIVLLALAVLDILLDGDFISWNVPHTHFL